MLIPESICLVIIQKTLNRLLTTQEENMLVIGTRTQRRTLRFKSDWAVQAYSYLSHVMRLWHFPSSVNAFSNAHGQPPSGARCLIFGQTLCLLPYFCVRLAKAQATCADMQVRLSLRWSPVRYVPKSHELAHLTLCRITWQILSSNLYLNRRILMVVRCGLKIPSRG